MSVKPFAEVSRCFEEFGFHAQEVRSNLSKIHSVLHAVASWCFGSVLVTKLEGCPPFALLRVERRGAHGVTPLELGTVPQCKRSCISPFVQLRFAATNRAAL